MLPAAGAGLFVAEQYRNHLGAKPAPLLTHCLLTRPIPASACGHDQVPQVNGRVQVPVMPGPAAGTGPGGFPLQVRVHRPAGAAGLAAGEPHGRQDHPGVAHWPLASALRAGSPYPRHLARALDFPVTAHPRQERGAPGYLNGVTAPGDDAGYVNPESNHQVGDQDSFPPSGLPGRFHHPFMGRPEPARHGASAPCLGAAWVVYNNRTSMTAFPFRSCWIRHLPHGAFGVEGLASPAIRGGQRWSGTLASRRGTL